MEIPHKKILVVDDDHAVRRLIVRVLTKNNYTVVESLSSLEAIYVFSENDFSMALIDIYLESALDGFELAEYFKERKPDCKIKFITGHPVGQRRWLDKSHLGPILKKPFTLNEFNKFIQR